MGKATSGNTPPRGEDQPASIRGLPPLRAAADVSLVVSRSECHHNATRMHPRTEGLPVCP